MSTHQLIATKTKTKTETKTCITTEQSQKLMQTMLTMSFGCLAFLRGLFPDENFVDQRFVPEKIEKNYNKNTTTQGNSIKIKTLVRGKSPDVDMLLDWLEKGVFHSIRLKFLKAMSLGIFLDENNPTDLIENYVFSFDYDKNNNVKLNINNSQKDDDSISLLDSRKMAQQLMRRFIIITQSLEPLPQKKFLSMRLMFNDNTDSKFQPPLFKDATFDSRATIKVPLSTTLETFSTGKLNTEHHRLELKVFSTSNEIETDDSKKENQKNKSFYKIIDPLEIIYEDSTSEVVENVTAKSKPSVESQTTSILGNFLRSSQPSIEATQVLGGIMGANLDCECGLPCNQNTSAVKTCKICRKAVHGICYGNFHKPSIPTCLTCMFGKSLDTSLASFKDLMMLRKCYRYIMRRRGIPSSFNGLVNELVKSSMIDNQITERVSWCISVLFQDEILSINSDIEQRTNKKPIVSKVLTDVPGIIDQNKSELNVGQTYAIGFVTITNNIHSCYIDTIPETAEQVNKWLQEVKELRISVSESLPSSCDLKSLDIQDTNTQDPIILGQKRKNFELNEYLKDGESSILDTQQNEPMELPKKIRKISVSKKTLRSVW